jgi:hypothetical protein
MNAIEPAKRGREFGMVSPDPPLVQCPVFFLITAANEQERAQVAELAAKV